MNEDSDNFEGPVGMLNDQEAATLLNVTVRTLFKATEPRGTLKCVRYATGVMYRPSDVQAYLDARRGA